MPRSISVQGVIPFGGRFGRHISPISRPGFGLHGQLGREPEPWTQDRHSACPLGAVRLCRRRLCATAADAAHGVAAEGGASSASVKTVYLGATKLSESAERLSDDVLATYVFHHYNWQYDFLRPTIEEIVAEYRRTHLGSNPPAEEVEEEAGVDESEEEPEAE